MAVSIIVGCLVALLLLFTVSYNLKKYIGKGRHSCGGGCCGCSGCCGKSHIADKPKFSKI